MLVMQPNALNIDLKKMVKYRTNYIMHENKISYYLPYMHLKPKNEDSDFAIWLMLVNAMANMKQIKQHLLI